MSLYNRQCKEITSMANSNKFLRELSVLSCCHGWFFLLIILCFTTCCFQSLSAFSTFHHRFLLYNFLFEQRRSYLILLHLPQSSIAFFMRPLLLFEKNLVLLPHNVTCNALVNNFSVILASHFKLLHKAFVFVLVGTYVNVLHLQFWSKIKTGPNHFVQVT